MTKRRFIDQVRQLRAQADAKHASFAAQVNNAAKLYLEHVYEDGASTAEQDAQLQWAQAFVEREYAPSDREFQWDVTT